jgi:predicted DCC family thiol-disulfide oxidoreductase YuxK
MGEGEIRQGTLRRPLIVYDGRCAFCIRSVNRAKSITGNRVDYEPYQEAASRFPAIDPKAFGKAVHLIEPDGRVSRGAEAVFAALALGGRYPWLIRFYRFLPGFARWSEGAYRLIATHRQTTDRIDMLLFGKQEQMPSYRLTRAIFLRLLGAIFLMAFVSAWVQIAGLVGSGGILPVQAFIEAVKEHFGNGGFWLFPTLCWFNASDHFLQFLCGGGVVAAILVVIGLQWPAMVACVVFYLSIAVAGQDFFLFQWDFLLVEAGFLAIFLCRLKFWKPRDLTEPSRTVILLLRWLLFRVLFMSGVVKLSSGDLSWRHWTALQFHYMTQPLPTWVGWYFFQLPAWFQFPSCGVVFLVELILPFFIFFPRRPRMIAFWGIIAFQLLIVITGNYGFFNWLTIALCFTLPDDFFWRRLLRQRGQTSVAAPPRWRAAVTLPLATILLIVTVPVCIDAFGLGISWPGPQAALANRLAAFRIANGYGLFAVMTTTRMEIIVEGSDDGQNWKAYEFKWKPGDVDRRPAFTLGHMPRLDWEMWFAALSDPATNPWFMQFMDRLRTGAPEVLSLLESNPFPDHPPKFIRAMAYDYNFTNLQTKRATGAWWKRRELTTYWQPDE